MATNIVSLLVDDKRYDIDLFDIDGLEWRDVRRATHMKAMEVVRAALHDTDLEAIAGLVWIWRRRTEPALTYEEVLKPLTLDSFGAKDEETPADPPD